MPCRGPISKWKSAGLVADDDEGRRSLGGNRQCAGGASQTLLKRQLNVIGIDPADMDPIVLANPNFKHIKMSRCRRAPA